MKFLPTPMASLHIDKVVSYLFCNISQAHIQPTTTAQDPHIIVKRNAVLMDGNAFWRFHF